jgi:hypothetical protein
MGAVRRRIPRPAALALLAFLALGPGCASRPAAEPAAEQWHWPEHLGPAREFDADRRSCEYDAASFRSEYPDLYRIQVSRCLQANGWVRGAPPPPPPRDAEPARDSEVAPD